MGFRYRMPNEDEQDRSFRIMEVKTINIRAGEPNFSTSQVLIVDNNWETLKFVHENMEQIVRNMSEVNKMAEPNILKVDDSARLFEKNLEPFFSVVAETEQNNVLDKLSFSLKKALLLMAMDRYHCDRDSICRALGLTPEKLEREMMQCGLGPSPERKAA